MFTIITNRLGDIFLLISIVITLNNGDSLPIYHLVNNNKYATYQLLGIIVAAITKSAQTPYSR